MIYRLKEFKGDTIPVPQLVFSKLGIAEEYNVRLCMCWPPALLTRRSSAPT
jgi:hypothetical protein